MGANTFPKQCLLLVGSAKLVTQRCCLCFISITVSPWLLLGQLG